MKIAMLLSGGVDSSVAMRLLHEAGHETAFYLKIWLRRILLFGRRCPWEGFVVLSRGLRSGWHSAGSDADAR
ncbi:MAG: hypothetical protein R3C26_26860 [Calditrichia bacterium]